MTQKIICAIFLLIMASSCGDTKPTGDNASEPIVGERINGPANIRDTINGKILFTLNDNVFVTCRPLENNWYIVGTMMDIDTSEFGMDILRKGRKILVDNTEFGKIMSDMEVSTSLGKDQAWATIIGYTHKDNIKSETIIENMLIKHIAKHQDRTLASYQSFIDKFTLEKDDQFNGYTLFYNYENWIDDPSPMWRIGLVFQDNLLIAILHSRPLTINQTTNYQLDRGFDCLVFNDTKNKKELLKMFNHFVNSVD